MRTYNKVIFVLTSFVINTFVTHIQSWVPLTDSLTLCQFDVHEVSIHSHMPAIHIFQKRLIL